MQQQQDVGPDFSLAQAALCLCLRYFGDLCLCLRALAELMPMPMPMRGGSDATCGQPLRIARESGSTEVSCPKLQSRLRASKQRF